MEAISAITGFIGVVVGAFLSYYLQTRLEDRKRKSVVHNTRLRLTNSLRVAQQLFDLANRTGGWPIQRKEPFIRLMALGFSDDVATLISATGPVTFYPVLARLETATASMWYSFEVIRAAQDRLSDSGSPLSNPDRAALSARIDEHRNGARAAAQHAQQLCESIRLMFGDDDALSAIEVVN